MRVASKRAPLTVSASLLALTMLGGFAPQKPFAECVADPEGQLALSYADFDQGVAPDGDGPRFEWGWRAIAQDEGCYAAVAELIARWRAQNGDGLNRMHRGTLALHEGQFRAAAGDVDAALPLIEEGRLAFSDAAGNAYIDAIVAFVQSDRPALLAARERLLAVPEPANWAEIQRMFREQAGQDMRWPINIEPTDRLVECFGKPYPVMDEC